VLEAAHLDGVWRGLTHDRRFLAGLLQQGGGPSANLDARLGIDVNDDQHAIVEELLELVGIARLGGGVQIPAERGATGAPR
jgi:hypothetical protein